MRKRTLSFILLLIFTATSISTDFLILKNLPFSSFYPIPAYAETPYCASTEPGAPSGVYDSNLGYCVTDPLDETGKCPTSFIYSSTYKRCVKLPLCPGLTIWNTQTKTCDTVTTSPSGGTEPTFPENSCAVDNNNNGEIEENEIYQCTQTQQGYICPVGQTQCTPQYATPTCPSGYTYNPTTQKCEYTPTIGVCSSQQVVITQYQCPITGQIYSDLTTCNSNCVQTAVCDRSTSCVSYGTGCPAGCGDNPVCNGSFSNTIRSYASQLGISVQETICYEDPRCREYSLSGSGVRIYLNGQLTSSSNLFYHIERYCNYIYINGYVGGRGSVTNICADVNLTCPLGSYPCTGSPPTCTKSQACITQDQTVTKWQCSLNGQQYDTQQQCTSSCYSGCPSGGTFNPNTGKCEATATCSQGTLQPEGCFTGYGCPLGNYQCHNINNNWLCSPYSCITSNQLINEGDTIPGGYEDDGARDSQGNCLGTILIFNGKGMRCRKSGVQTGFHNCCNESQGKLYDSTGSTGGGIGSLFDMGKALYSVYRAIYLGQLSASLAQSGGSIVLDQTNNFAQILITGSGSARISFSEGLILAGNNCPAGVCQIVPGGQVSLNVPANAVNANITTGGTMSDYIQQSGLVSAVVSLATSFVISDPVLSAAVNTVAQAVLWSLGYANPITFAGAVFGLASALFQKKCDQQDIITSTFKESGYCHEVGEWCVKKWPLVGCVQKAKGFCCFNSKLARIIHEQGRPQLEVFQPNGAWTGIPGDPNFSVKNPNCRGFTPEEFQALDFNKIDLGEYIEDIQKNIRQNLAPQLQQQIQQSWGK